jgi:hypothetical protein
LTRRVNTGVAFYDTYPDGLGVATLGWLREHLLTQPDGRVVLHPEVAGMVARLRMVDESTDPTPQQRAVLAAFTDPAVSTGTDWYSALRECQGNPHRDPARRLHDRQPRVPAGFPVLRVGYLIDADADTFEVYEGFNKTRTPTAGRWAGVRNPERETLTGPDGTTFEQENYQPVELIWAIGIAELPAIDLDIVAGVQARQRDEAEVS